MPRSAPRALALCALALALVACDSMGPTDPGGSVVTGVEIVAAVAEVAMGETLRLEAEVRPASAPQGVTWASDDEAVARVDGAGRVTGVASGTARITATSTADPTRSAAVQITVSDCPSPREAGGVLSGGATWENWIDPPACVDYVVTRNVTTQGLLAIEPGVRAAFAEDVTLVVRGAASGLRAAGTATEPIVLTGTEARRGHWGAVWLDGADHAENRLEHVTIEHGGGGSFSGSITRGNLLITGGAESTLLDATLREGSAFGLSMASGAALRAHGRNRYTANAAGPAHVSASQAHFLDATSTADGNDVDLVAVDADDVTGAVTWVPMGDGYLVEQESDRYAFDVAGPDGDLRLAAGVRIAFEDDMAMTVAAGGRLRAEGTAAEPVVLTGAMAGRGSWRGLRVFSAADNRLAHTVVEGGGSDTHSGSVEPGNVFVATDAAVRVTDSTLRGGAGYGLVAMEGVSLPGFARNALTDNALGAAHVRATVADDLDAASSYTGNGRDVVDVYAYVSVLTEDTEWRDLGVPYVITDTPVGLAVDGAAFTVGRGVEILFQGDIGLGVTGGVLTLAGTETAPIRLAGDDGAWKGIELLRSTGTLTHVAIDGAGSSSWGSIGDPAALTLTAASGDPAHADLGPGTSQTGAAVGLEFRPGATTATGCGRLVPVSIPTGSTYGQHCL
ncbi:Ig-like domain-containing protein [Rubrivirga marina]|uniref:BIG2 domain-containing protein n=1 Tax=Rubrivirga marina TaxID=1196024 RepID=A0A271IY54_9BACT|nr:Ig-like domain-containing protein [Rubrivirga marina]PAP75635.1 hypothetical protein BSZ37_03885 [Rubrivirga marina]